MDRQKWSNGQKNDQNRCSRIKDTVFFYMHSSSFLAGAYITHNATVRSEILVCYPQAASLKQWWGLLSSPDFFHFQTCSLQFQPTLPQVTSFRLCAAPTGATKCFIQLFSHMYKYSRRPVNRLSFVKLIIDKLRGYRKFLTCLHCRAQTEKKLWAFKFNQPNADGLFDLLYL